MSKTSKFQVPEPDISKDHLNYIIVPEEKDVLPERSDLLKFFLPEGRTKRIESVDLRPENDKYLNTEEDKFLDDREDGDFLAWVYHNENAAFFYVHVPHMGRIYFAQRIIQVADILKSLLANEAAKLRFR